MQSGSPIHYLLLCSSFDPLHFCSGHVSSLLKFRRSYSFAVIALLILPACTRTFERTYTHAHTRLQEKHAMSAQSLRRLLHRHLRPKARCR